MISADVSNTTCLLNFSYWFYLFCEKKMSFEYFEVESHVSTYNKFRPCPPKPLIERIVEYILEKMPEPLDLAVDVGCGSGQSTEVLAPYFKKVWGLDPSAQIIKEARKNCHNSNVFYSVSPGEKMDLEDSTASLVSICQALHWLDIPKFYSEADRLLKPNGVLAVYGYNLPLPVYKDNKDLEKIIEKYYKNILGDYTLPQSRKVYLDNYTSNEFNEVYFVEDKKMKREENFILETEGNINDIVGYMTSWSAFQNYVKQEGEKRGQDLLNKFKDEFNTILETETSDTDNFKIKFKYFLLLGRKVQN